MEGNESPIRVKLPAVGPGASRKLHFENNMRTGLAIKDNQLHRWSAREPGVLAPPASRTPFRSMHYGPSADGRSVISPVEGRVFDTGTWPPRPSGGAFPTPGGSDPKIRGRNRARTGGSRRPGSGKMGATGGSGGSPGLTAGPRSAH